MLHIVGSEDGQFDGTTNTIVGTQSGALSRQPLTIDVGLDGVFIKIKLYIDKFVAHHIHVALEDHSLAIFHALGGWFADDDVACFVDFRVE